MKFPPKPPFIFQYWKKSNCKKAYLMNRTKNIFELTSFVEPRYTFSRDR